MIPRGTVSKTIRYFQSNKKSLKLKFHLFLYNICTVCQKMCFVLYLWVIVSVLTVELSMSILFLQKVVWLATDGWRSESRQKWSRNFWRYTTGLQISDPEHTVQEPSLALAFYTKHSGSSSVCWNAAMLRGLCVPILLPHQCFLQKVTRT